VFVGSQGVPGNNPGNAAGTSLGIDQFYVVKPGATASLNQTLRVTRPDTVVLGLGLATFIPDNGITAMTVADVGGVKVAGVLFDAGTTNSQTLVEVGPAGSAADHAANPTSLHDVYFRVGSAAVGRATTSLVVNSDDVIGDHVTMYGLFVEHYQKHQTVWNGNGGRTYFNDRGGPSNSSTNLANLVSYP
jgi:hypothetical protein